MEPAVLADRATEQPSALPIEPAGVESIEGGALVGRYVILQRSARGGWASSMPPTILELERKVALKLVRLGVPRPSVALLAREAHALARVSHPNVVAVVYDVGYRGDQVYLVMEFVRGVEPFGDGCSNGLEPQAKWSTCCAPQGRVSQQRIEPSWFIGTSNPRTS